MNKKFEKIFLTRTLKFNKKNGKQNFDHKKKLREKKLFFFLLRLDIVLLS